MIVSTAAKALLLRGPKVLHSDPSDRPVIGGQSQGVGWAKEKDDGQIRGGEVGDGELAKVSFSDICGQHTWKRKLSRVSRLESSAELSQPARYLTFPPSNYPQPSLKEIELSDASTAIPSPQRAFKMCQ